MSRPTSALGAYLSTFALCLLPACEDDNGGVVPDARPAGMTDAGMSSPPDGPGADGARPEAGAADGSAPAAAGDLDIAVVRLNPDGTLDTSFGSGGIARVDFGAGSAPPPAMRCGASPAMPRTGWCSSDRRRGGDDRNDSRPGGRSPAPPAGAVDTTFATHGQHTCSTSPTSATTPATASCRPTARSSAPATPPSPPGVGTQTANRSCCCGCSTTACRTRPSGAWAW